MHFTVLPFTNDCGDPVMCVAIFKSYRTEDILSSWCQGIDLRKVDGEGWSQLDENSFIERSFASGSVAGGGPTCTINGKEIPTWCLATPHGGFTLASTISSALGQFGSVPSNGRS
mgnify:CR=1 FL=1